MNNDNEKLKEFSTISDDQLHEGNNAETTQNHSPNVDLFNTASNTQLTDDDETRSTDKENVGKDEETPSGKIKLGKVISGKNAVAMINIFIPSFVVFAFRRAGYSTSKPEWKLNKEEQETMTPVVQQCLDYIIINFDNPFYALAFVAVMIYGSKAMDAIPELSKIKQDALSDNTKADLPAKPDTPINSNNSPLFKEYRDRILATSVRKEKTKIIVECIERHEPKNMTEAAKIYQAIFPERTEGYFHEWYNKNLEAIPNSLRFDGTTQSTDKEPEFSLEDEK